MNFAHGMHFSLVQNEGGGGGCCLSISPLQEIEYEHLVGIENSVSIAVLNQFNLSLW